MPAAKAVLSLLAAGTLTAAALGGSNAAAANGTGSGPDLGRDRRG